MLPLGGFDAGVLGLRASIGGETYAVAWFLVGQTDTTRDHQARLLGQTLTRGRGPGLLVRLGALLDRESRLPASGLCLRACPREGGRSRQQRLRPEVGLEGWVDALDDKTQGKSDSALPVSAVTTTTTARSSSAKKRAVQRGPDSMQY